MLPLLIAAMVVYAIVGAKGLLWVCRSGSGFWCNVSYIGYFVVAILIARVFYAWFKPKS